MCNRFKFSTCLFLFFILSQSSFAQLSSFSLNVTKSDESCTGNGTLFFNVSGISTGASVFYSIYSLPNTTSPITVVSTNTFSGLSAGIFRVIATQTLGNSSNTQQQDIQILDSRTLLTYQVSSQQINCISANVVVTVLSGNPVSYEIVSGPLIVAPQTSNVFNNLGAGVYNIRVNDSCGDGVVQTFTLSLSNPLTLSMNNFSTKCTLLSCNSVATEFWINAATNTIINYPLSVQYTIFPPSGGAPLIQNQIVTSGNSISQAITSAIPFYHNQPYLLNIKVTDLCGNSYYYNPTLINLQYSVNSQQIMVGCLKGIQISLCVFLPPYTVNFLSAPAGFNPVLYNNLHPGPFNPDFVNYVSLPSSQIPNGNYTIEVADSCGRVLQTQVLIQDVLPGYEFVVDRDECSGNTIVRIPNGGPSVVSVVITTAPSSFNHALPYDVSFNINSGSFQMALPPGTYTFEGVDVCGQSFSYVIIIPIKVVNITTSVVNPIGCSNNGVISVQASGTMLSSIVITQAPSNFNHVLPYNVSNTIIGSANILADIDSLPSGTYVLYVTDSCGIHYIKSVVVASSISQLPLQLFEMKGCGENLDSISLSSPNGALQSVIITAAPSSFSNPVPFNVSANITNNGIFYMNSLPQGTYTFYSKDICNVERTETIQIIGYHQINNTIQVIGNCSSFNLNMNYTDNNANSHNFWLQKFNPITNQWTHPITGVPYVTNSIPTQTNSYLLTNLSVNFNIASLGQFRIVQEYYYYSNGDWAVIPCIETIKTFDFTGELKIITAYGIPCVSSGSQIFIIADGVAPLSYKITTKDGLPFIVNNGTSNAFSGLQPGIYNFKVEDVCGNVVNRLYDIANLPVPIVTATNLCDGLNGELSVQSFPLLNYQWWKGTNTSTILSTSNILNFIPFNSSNDSGTYYIRVYSSNSNSCVDRIIPYTVPATNNPNAGQDGSLIICGSTTTINLFSLLVGNYDLGGIWEEVSNSGMLVGSNWSPLGLPYGIYVFKYKVTGFCNIIDEASIVITYNPIAEAPIISANLSYCENENIQFSVQSIANATYQWSGPNNFSSTSQNPTIVNSTLQDSGIYTVTVSVNGCQSSSYSDIAVLSIPQFTYQSSCVNGAYTVLISPINNSFNANSATYQWIGPNGFSSSNNPIIITNQSQGNYSVIVTNNEGCSINQSILVPFTFCDFPNVITPNEDGNNDTFDLSGFDISKFQVFNRWGSIVYEENNYTNQWHGQNKSNGDLPDATYFYYVQLKSGEEKHGWVLLAKGH
ncbi:gliding motility-associated C-terminal domain-containing protein [Flavobacterium sp.]|uniref:T9SS type B sorting domain-containing protein n=1 Tax=Flavobacterium sp. TaxID=239 RepID=UPI00375250CF